MSGIHFTGRLGGWATPKNFILHLAGKLTVQVSKLPTLKMSYEYIQGGTGRISEYFSLGVASESCTGEPNLEM
jgi:homoaconitase